MKPSVAIIGCGTVGTALAKRLSKSGYTITGVSTRNLDTAATVAATVGAKQFSDSPFTIGKNAQIVFLTTPDDVIQSICADIARHGGFDKGSVVVHCSGALGSQILSAARDCQAMVASVHPLQSFASATQAEQMLPGSYWAVEGDKSALVTLRRLVEDLGGICLEIGSGQKTLYHAAAVVASNYLVALLDVALALNRQAGIAPEISFKALLPLIEGTLKNIGAKGIPEALTGPIARGDVKTVHSHLTAIGAYSSELALIYKTLGRYTVDLAKAKGSLADKAAQEIVSLLRVERRIDVE